MNHLSPPPMTAMTDSTLNLAVKLNWYRQSELEGSVMLGRITGRVSDPHLIARLTRHCAEEAEHSLIWANTISTLGLPMLRIRRSYQSFYMNHGSAPASVLEVLCFTHIFERSVPAVAHQRALRKTSQLPRRIPVVDHQQVTRAQTSRDAVHPIQRIERDFHPFAFTHRVAVPLKVFT